MATSSPTPIRPLFALAGAGDLVVERLRGVPTELAKLPTELAKLPTELAKVPTQLQTQFEQLSQLPQQVQTRANAAGVVATAVYGELVTRGEKVYATLRGQSTSTARAAKSTATKASKPTAS